MTAVHAGNLNFKWDPKSLEIRTLAVERLVTQVTTLVNTNSKGKKRANWMLKCPNGMTVPVTSLCWPSRCA
uniref:Uncharacterized protein n=1 Tax=Theropithecus gelada TaxID=9565 RepID=A0A8D2F477_THEGE